MTLEKYANKWQGCAWGAESAVKFATQVPPALSSSSSPPSSSNMFRLNLFLSFMIYFLLCVLVFLFVCVFICVWKTFGYQSILSVLCLADRVDFFCLVCHVRVSLCSCNSRAILCLCVFVFFCLVCLCVRAILVHCKCHSLDSQTSSCGRAFTSAKRK